MYGLLGFIKMGSGQNICNDKQPGLNVVDGKGQLRHGGQMKGKNLRQIQTILCSTLGLNVNPYPYLSAKHSCRKRVPQVSHDQSLPYQAVNSLGEVHSTLALWNGMPFLTFCLALVASPSVKAILGSPVNFAAFTSCILSGRI